MKIDKSGVLIALLSKTILFACLFLFNECGIAQSSITDKLKSQFEQYQINHLQEKIFVHTDKTFYLAGETIWFKAYIVDGFMNKPLPLSKVIYIDLIDRDLKAVMQTKIGVDDAMGNGSLAIPIAIKSGNYTLRAYTQAMKNYSPDFFFEQNITIINTLLEMPLPNDSISNQIDVQFFPEGGNLVAGLESKTAFKATDKNGKGINCSGVVINDKNDTLLGFKSLKYGMGNFTFTPKKNETYKAIIKTDNNIRVIQNLPKTYNAGYTFNLTERNDGLLTVTVNSSTEFGNFPIYLFIHSHQLIKSVQTSVLTNGKAIFNIDKKDLADGISHFTIFNNDKKPVCERLYFKQPISRLLIKYDKEKENYALRENAKLNITTTDEANNLTAANLSMSVFLIDSLQPETYTDIQNYLLLCSDLKGKIESSDYYFNNKNIDATIAIDNLMLTQGWRRFKWENVLQEKTPYFEYLPEYEGLVLNGKLIDKATGQPVKHVTEYLSIPNKTFNFLNATSDANGNIKYILRNVYGSNEIIAETDSNNNYQLEIDNPFSNLFSVKKHPLFYISNNFQNNLLQRHIAMQVQHTYNIEANKKFIASSADVSVFYGTPTYSFNLDAFTRFNTMEEVIKEFITDVQLRTRNNTPYFRVFDRATQSLFNSDPLLLIDGVPILDANKIVSFNPLKIKTIDVVASKYYLGNATYDGIVSFKTYDGDLGTYQLDPNAVVLKFDGLQQQREFYNPTYETKIQQQSRIPDFRNVLCWKPNLKTDITGKTTANFYTSDIAGKFAIVIQGITKSGKSGSYLSTFEVKP